jgi:hypothetical protein
VGKEHQGTDAEGHEKGHVEGDPHIIGFARASTYQQDLISNGKLLRVWGFPKTGSTSITD